MPRNHTPSFLACFVALAAILMLIVPASAFTESYCSSQNTGVDNSYYTWPYQSNGNCTNHCNTEVRGDFAFAVIKYEECWCSNLIPQQQTSQNRCAKDCPGYPAEHCGDKDSDLYIYIKLNGQPSGTAGGSQPTSQPPSSKPSSSPQTSQPPVQQTSVTVISESGGVVTKTVYWTPSQAPTSSSAPVRTDGQGGGNNVGAIAGGVTGGIVGLLAVVGGILYFLHRRKQKQLQMHDEMNGAGIGGGSTGITRNTSTMSSAGLLGRGGGNGIRYPPAIATNVGSANTRLGDHDSISPISDRRNSQLIPIDSRLNPKAVLTFANNNASRDSLASLDDSRDYGRQLNVRNPDP